LFTAKIAPNSPQEKSKKFAGIARRLVETYKETTRATKEAKENAKKCYRADLYRAFVKAALMTLMAPENFPA